MAPDFVRIENDDQVSAKLLSFLGELFCLVTSMESTKNYLLAKRDFIVATDHRSLCHLFRSKEPSAYVLRLLQRLAVFGNFKLTHISGKANFPADSLSRAPLIPETDWETVTKRETQENILAAVLTRAKAKGKGLGEQPEASKAAAQGQGKGKEGNTGLDATQDISLPDPKDSWKSWKELQKECSDLRVLFSWLKDGAPKREEVKRINPALRSYFANLSQLKLDDGVITRIWVNKDGSEIKLVICPEYLIPTLLKETHDHMAHRGVDGSLSLLRSRFYFYSMQKSVEDWIKSCIVCARRKLAHPKAPLVQPDKGYFNHMVYMDLKVLNATPSDDFNYVMVLVDGFTKFCVLEPLKTKTSMEIFSKIYTSWVCVFGCMQRLITDQAKEFHSQAAQEFYELTSIFKSRTTSWHPQSDMAEAFVKNLSTAVTALLLQDDKDEKPPVGWHEKVKYAQMCLNATGQRSTGFSPFYLLTGSEMLIPSPLHLSVPQAKTEVGVAVRNLRARQNRMFEAVFESMGRSLASQKRLYDLKVKGPEIKAGDTVLYRSFTPQPHEVKAFKSMYRKELYTVVRVLGVNLLIKEQNDEGEGSNRIVHYNQVRPFVPRVEPRTSDRRTERTDRYGDNREKDPEIS